MQKTYRRWRAEYDKYSHEVTRWVFIPYAKRPGHKHICLGCEQPFTTSTAQDEGHFCSSYCEQRE